MKISQVLIHLQLNIVNWEKIEGLVSYKWIQNPNFILLDKIN